MNKTEKLWAALLVVGLVGYLGWQLLAPKPKQSAAPRAEQVVYRAQTPAIEAPKAAAAEVAPAAPAAPEAFATLENEQVRLTLSSRGARVIKAEFKQYKAENREDAPAVVCETGDLLALGLPGGDAASDYAILASEPGKVVFGVTLAGGVALQREIVLEGGYALSVKDRFSSAAATTVGPYAFGAGAMSLPKAQGEALGADFLAQGERKPEYCESRLGKILGARSAFLGCGTSSDPTGLPLSAEERFAGAQAWVALKSRFFVALVQPQVAVPATLTVARDGLAKSLKVSRVSATFAYPAVALQPGVTSEVTTRLYLGPKKYDQLRAFGGHADAVMDFGFFGWVCKLLLPILNGFYWLIPNYGVAIILLTLLVRLVFWPLTHKSTVAMRKMSVIQPQIKALQQQFKDQPQKIQQETFKLYREHKVNPFSSCLPMLVQIPIFIALFVVLRSAIELRFASFLWIADLSQPENLFAGFLPVPLNILPILTAVTMGLQTALSPSTGDAAQKKMMTWMMPIMMLFMFYQMASALCLYWTVSQALSIVQMWLIQRSAKAEASRA